MSEVNLYRNKLKNKMDEFAHFIYKITRTFPKEELFGATSQFRRASLSVILNYIEGYARKRSSVQLNFFETSYGSFQEAKYLLDFCYKEAWISDVNYKKAIQISDEIGAMLWTEIKNLEASIKK